MHRIQSGSYESTLSDDQRIELHDLLTSELTLHQARVRVAPWPSGPERGKKPAISSLWRIRVRLRLEEKLLQIEETRLTERVLRKSLRQLTASSDQEAILDQISTLIGHQVIEAALGGQGNESSKMAAAWLLLRRADQRRYDQRVAMQAAAAEKEEPTAEEPSVAPLREQMEGVLAGLREVFGGPPAPLETENETNRVGQDFVFPACPPRPPA